MIVEIGGTVGEYQNILFLEAARMMKMKNPEDVAFVLVSYLPVPGHLGEMKTKPTQYAARTLNSSGIQADFIVARGKSELDKPRREKLALFCGLRSENDVISAPDAESIYDVPNIFEKQNFAKLLSERLSLKLNSRRNHKWDDFVDNIKKSNKKLRIGVVGKYFGTGDFTLADSYISVIEAIKHASWQKQALSELVWLDSEEFEKQKGKISELSNYDAIIVPGGFGSRGVEGIIMAIKYARENNIPYLGLCYGMQLAAVEFTRNILGLAKANTVEIDKNTTEPIIHINPNQAENVKKNRYGGTMRLGAYSCQLKKETKAQKLYKEKIIFERHRHRYEFNNDYLKKLEDKGMIFSGINPESNLVEIIELKNHPYFIGSQFHPEFKSRPLKPHPLFIGLVEAALERSKVNQEQKEVVFACP